MQAMLENLHYALRQLRKSPVFTLTAVLTLALGIGANTAIFTVVYATLLAPMPYPEPDQLVMVWSKIQGDRNGIAAQDFVDWKNQSTVFQDLNALTGGSFNLATKDQPEYVEGQLTTPGMYRMMGVKFQYGRDFLPEEGVAGKEHVVVLMNKLWKRLGSDPNIIGKQLRIDGTPYTVVGVLAPGPARPARPVAGRAAGLQARAVESRLPLAARDGPPQARRHHQAGAGRHGLGDRQHRQAFPKSNKGWGAFVEPLKNDFLPKERIQTSLDAAWRGGLCAADRLRQCGQPAAWQREPRGRRKWPFAHRSAHRAKTSSRSSSPRTCCWHWSAAFWESASALVALRGAGCHHAAKTRFPLKPISLSTCPSCCSRLRLLHLAGLLFGCAPAWYATRVDPAEALKEGGRSGTGAGRHRLRSVLVIGEFALALALLTGAGLAIHSFWNLTHVDLGVNTVHVQTFFLPVPDSRPKDPAQINAYYQQMLASIKAVPGVLDAAVSVGLPLEGPGFGMPFTIAGQPEFADPSQRPGAGFEMVTPDYFKTYGIQVMRGRAFTDQDNAGSVHVAMVNEEFVHKFFKGKDPLQQRINVEELIPGVTKLGPYISWQIVGVFHNVRAGGFREDFPEIEIPFWQIPWPSANIGVRTAGDPATMTKSIAAAVHSVDPQIALAEPRTLEEVKSLMLAGDRFTMTLYAAFAIVALLLAAVGIYGVMAFTVAQREHEIGLRMALGASRGNVVSLVLKEALVLALVGLGLGLVGAYFVGRAMHSTLYGVGSVGLRRGWGRCSSALRRIVDWPVGCPHAAPHRWSP